jgi:hypothetical protein
MSSSVIDHLHSSERRCFRTVSSGVDWKTCQWENPASAVQTTMFDFFFHVGMASPWHRFNERIERALVLRSLARRRLARVMTIRNAAGCRSLSLPRLPSSAGWLKSYMQHDIPHIDADKMPFIWYVTVYVVLLVWISRSVECELNIL